MTQSTAEMTGLKCPPDTGPSARMSTASPSAVAVEFSSSCRPTWPGESRSAAMPEPTTMVTSRAVPTNSASRRRGMDVSTGGAAGRSGRLRQPVDDVAHRVEGARPQPVVGEPAGGLGGDEAGLPQGAQVVGHQGLAEVELLLEVADAERLPAEQPEDPQPDRVGDHPQHVGGRRCRTSGG